MAIQSRYYFDRVYETTRSSGTGDLTLDGAVTGYLSFADGVSFPDGAADADKRFTYVIEAVDIRGTPTGLFEVGRGYVNISEGVTTLVRESVIVNSKNTASKIEFGSDLKNVYIDVSADDLNYLIEGVANNAELIESWKNTANASAQAAAVSETNAATSETNAASSASAAAVSEEAAKASETNAATSETNAASSASAAAVSETNAATSEANTDSYLTQAIAAKDMAVASAQAAAVSEEAAKASETNAATSETNAASSASAAAVSEANAKKYADSLNTENLQPKLTFDTEPTDGSSNPVTSDGIKKAIDAKDALPAQTGNTGKYLKTDGSKASWSDLTGTEPNPTKAFLDAYSGTNDYEDPTMYALNAIDAGEDFTATISNVIGEGWGFDDADTTEY